MHAVYVLGLFTNNNTSNDGTATIFRGYLTDNIVPWLFNMLSVNIYLCEKQRKTYVRARFHSNRQPPRHSIRRHSNTVHMYTGLGDPLACARARARIALNSERVCIWYHQSLINFSMSSEHVNVTTDPTTRGTNNFVLLLEYRRKMRRKR